MSWRARWGTGASFQLPDPAGNSKLRRLGSGIWKLGAEPITNMAGIASTAVALPDHKVSQEEAREVCARFFREHPRLAALMEIFDRAGVQDRYMSFPPAYYFENHPFSKRNSDYIEHALKLGGR